MHPILFDSPRVATYGLMVVLAVVAGWFVARRAARRVGIDPSHIDLMAPLVVAAGVAGGWLFGQATAAVLTEHRAVSGRVLYGSLIMSVGAGIAYCLIARIPLGRMGDALAASLAVGVAIGRLGCYFAGCCWGDVCAARGDLRGLDDPLARQMQTVPAISGEGAPTAVQFPAGSWAHRQHVEAGLLEPHAAHSLAVHPVQLYEAVATTLLALAIVLCFRKRRVWGEAFLWFGIGYAGIRFIVEFLRADNAPVIGTLSFSQLICVATAAVCAALFIVRRRFAERWGLRIVARPEPQSRKA